MFPFLCFSLLFPISPSPFLSDGRLIPPISSPSRARAYTLLVCVNCLHSFTDGGEGLKIRGIGVKAKVKEKSEDIELKSKVVKGIRPLRGVFLWVVKAVKAKNVDYSVMCARNTRTRARRKRVE